MTRLVVATSKVPQGPFVIVNDRANLEVSGAGDFTIMIDPQSSNATAYIAYDAWGNNHALVIEELTPDYHDALGALASTGPISPVNNEAPLLFERKGYCEKVKKQKYYVGE